MPRISSPAIQAQQALPRTWSTPPTPQSRPGAQPTAAEQPVSSATLNTQHAPLSTDPSQDVVQGLINALARRRNYDREQAEQIVRAMIERRNSNSGASGPVSLSQAYVEYQKNHNGTHK
jgi:hypothetical protein